MDENINDHCIDDSIQEHCNQLGLNPMHTIPKYESSNDDEIEQPFSNNHQYTEEDNSSRLNDCSLKNTISNSSQQIKDPRSYNPYVRLTYDITSESTTQPLQGAHNKRKRNNKNVT